VLRQLLEVEQAVVGALECADELVELDLHASPSRFWVFWMTKHHEERDDPRRRVDHELPGFE
jgi:hypothetical protein